MPGMTAPLHAPAVVHALAGRRLGHPVYLFQRIGSTNDEAKRLAVSGAPEGALVLAETQTAGRGRAGRTWLTPPGAALALSLVLRPNVTPRQAARLTMLAGVAVCEALEAVAGVRPALKWPNDILLGERKAGGILVESGLAGERLEYAVLGIGLNVSAAPPPEQVEFPATALEVESGRVVDRLTLLAAILDALAAHYDGLAEGTALQAAWQARLAWLGQTVVARTAAGEVTGLAEGVDADGALLVRLASGEQQRLLAADVRLRPSR